MKQFVTLLVIAGICLTMHKAIAQEPASIFVDFTNGLPPGTCWDDVNVKYESDVMGQSNKTTAATSKAANYASITTPYIIIPENGTISFIYNSSDKNNNKTLRIEVSLIGKDGIVKPLSTLYPTGKDQLSYTSIAGTIAAGSYRILIEFYNTDNAGGDRFSAIDNLRISGSYDAYSCNSAPVAVNDVYYNNPVLAPFSANVLLNDYDPNSDPPFNETFTVTSYTQPSNGKVEMAPDGTFTFTPSETFTGGTVTFTYTITDNGFPPLSSTATVTITYPTAPVARDDNFASPTTGSTITGNVTTNDSSPNGQVLIASLVTAPDSGTLVFNPDGTFTYTPPVGFVGPITFTYRLTDNFYSPLYSNTATVTINYPEIITVPLPIKLISFNGSISSNRAQLKWLVAANETGDHFQILRSSDGKSYSEIGLIKVSDKVGEDYYAFTDSKELTKTTYYKIKIFNKDNSIAYSNIVVLRPGDVNNMALKLLVNPVASTLSFTYTTQEPNDYNVAVYTAAGVKTWSRKVHLQKGENNVSLSLDNALPAGMYILEVSNGVERQVIKLVKK